MSLQVLQLIQRNSLLRSEEVMSKKEKMDTLSSKSSSKILDEINFSNNVSTDTCNGLEAAGSCSETTEEENVIYYEYLRSVEIQTKRRPIPDYIEKIQKDITSRRRRKLVDWLVEVADSYELISDTLYLTVSYVDRFLSLKTVNEDTLQLLGVSCMFIASKYEEVRRPDIESFCYITDNTYSHEDVLKMEPDLLKVLNFEIGNPTIKTFLKIFTRAAQAGDCEKFPSTNSDLEFLGCYLAELSLLNYCFIRFLPSLVAASVVFLAKFTIQPKMHPWNSTLERYSGYKPSDLKDCVMAIHGWHQLISRRECKSVAIRDKYKQDKFKCVSTWKSPSKIPKAYFEDV